MVVGIYREQNAQLQANTPNHEHHTPHWMPTSPCKRKHCGCSVLQGNMRPVQFASKAVSAQGVARAAPSLLPHMQRECTVRLAHVGALFPITSTPSCNTPTLTPLPHVQREVALRLAHVGVLVVEELLLLLVALRALVRHLCIVWIRNTNTPGLLCSSRLAHHWNTAGWSRCICAWSGQRRFSAGQKPAKLSTIKTARTVPPTNCHNQPTLKVSASLRKRRFSVGTAHTQAYAN